MRENRTPPTTPPAMAAMGTAAAAGPPLLVVISIPGTPAESEKFNAIGHCSLILYDKMTKIMFEIIHIVMTLYTSAD